jgi:hypothetical protein
MNNDAQGQWRRSTRCSTGACTIVKIQDGGPVQVADSKLGDASPILAFDPPSWMAFIDDLKATP